MKIPITRFVVVDVFEKVAVSGFFLEIRDMETGIRRGVLIDRGSDVRFGDYFIWRGNEGLWLPHESKGILTIRKIGRSWPAPVPEA